MMKLVKMTRNPLIQVRASDPPTWHAKDVVGMTIYGAIQPLVVRQGRSTCTKSMNNGGRKGFTQVRAAEKRKTLLLLLVYWLCESTSTRSASPGKVRRELLREACWCSKRGPNPSNYCLGRPFIAQGVTTVAKQ